MTRPDSPGVLLIIADDWSPIAGCYGNDVIATPNVDRLANQGSVFDLAFCTSPSCAVSRACILTGMHAHTHGQYGHCHGIHGFRTHESVRALPAVLKDAGIRADLHGKSHVAPASVYPFIGHADYDWAGSDGGPDTTGLVPATIRRNAASFVDSCRGGSFYLHVAPYWPHRMNKGFGGDRFPDEFDMPTYSPADVVVPDFLPDLPDVRQDLANYYQAVSKYDACVGAAIAGLEDSGRLDDTLIIVMTDHAMPFPGAKACSYDTGHRCPLIVRRPGQRGGVRNAALVNWVDITPTVYDWLGVPRDAWPDTLAGRSFADIIDTPQAEGWDETCFSHCFHEVTNYFPYRVLRGRKYKYVRNLAWQLTQPLPSDLFRSLTWAAVRRDDVQQLGKRKRQTFMQRDREELFDIENDPMETTNLIDRPELADVAERMRRQVIQWRQDTKDPWLEQSFQEGELTEDVHVK